MKIIFLDIDGVLNNDHTFDALKAQHKTLAVMDPRNVANLNSLIASTAAAVVVSSAWRHSYTVPQLREQLVKFGFEYPAKVIGTTPRSLETPAVAMLATQGKGIKMSMDVRRVWEIYEWLMRHTSVSGFAILDVNFIGEPYPSEMQHKATKPLMARFIQTDDRTGLTIKNTRTVAKRLGIPWAGL